MIDLNIEKVDEVLEELKPFLTSYWDEADERRDDFAEAIDLDSYVNLNEVGFLTLYTARIEGELVGFMPVIESPCLHTSRDKAVAEMIYVSPTHRRKGISKSLVQYAEEDLREKGSTILFFGLKTELPHNNLIESLNYSHVENLYMKVL